MEKKQIFDTINYVPFNLMKPTSLKLLNASVNIMHSVLFFPKSVIIFTSKSYALH